MGNSISTYRAFAAALLGGTALSCLLPGQGAEAACVATPGATQFDVSCTGATVLPAPITYTVGPAEPASVAVILGSDGNPASVSYTTTASAAFALTLQGGAGTFGSIDTGNLGAPSSIVGATDGVGIQSTNGASILIGQNSAGGAGLNANVTGQNGYGILALAASSGAVSITTAPGTLITGTGSAAIFAQVADGNAQVVFNGDVLTTNFSGQYDVEVSSTGAGNITIGGSGNALAGGISAVSSGTGGIIIQGSGNTTDLANGPGILAEITNAANNSAIQIARGGFIVGALDGITATTAGGGDITIATAGNVTGLDGYGVSAATNGGLTTINVGAASTIWGSAGPLNLSGTSIVNNAGAISFVNGVAANTIWNATTLNGQGGSLAIDVNTASAAADHLQVTTLSGANSIQIHAIGAAGLITTPIPILTAANLAPGATVAAAYNPGLINYSVVQQTPGDYFLTSQVNAGAAGATPTSISAILTALNTGFFQNASAFVSEPPNPERNQINGGPWIRVAAGQNDVSSIASAQNPNGITSAQEKVRTSFNGFQTGLDLGVANVEGTGWNTHLGVTAGQVLLRTNDLYANNVNSNVQVPFMGIYGAVTGHGFFGDFLIREDFYGMKLNNPAASLAGSNLNGKAFAANVSAGYRFDLPSSWFVEPSAAFMYSNLHIDTLRVGLDSSQNLVFDPFASKLGRFGVRVGTTVVLDRFQLALQPFLSGSVWREFAGSTVTNFNVGPTLVPLTDTRIGTFGQIGLGVSGQVLNSGFLGFVRGDYRFGANITGYALVAGLRYQF
ncbi:autotransporter domain-containing protein [Methylocapsa aurea]|uniref:autotransporter domain-containing protein n=1 Tax=Methylocapsa aurea TaxID=663610 RepID=UPI0012EBD8F6|nr:autotransporter domain-containing protein [Methylocapsa aurea]